MPDTMSFVVTKSSPALVGPCEPTPPSNLELSSFDKAIVSIPIASLHVFERGVHEPVKTIRRALSQALVPYYPIAGRLTIEPHDGELQIACTGEGVVFVAASANCTLEDVKFLEPPLAIPLHELTAEDGLCEMTSCDPFLSMQITEFSCGGFIVGMTWRHVIADGIGMAQFLQAVAELARGLPSPTVVPVRYDNSLPDLPPMMTALGQSVVRSVPQDFAYSDITIPSGYINRIKAEFHNHTDQPCSLFEVVTSTIWQCRTRAINSDPNTPAQLIFAANVRKHVQAKIGYYGNCGTFQPVVATSSTVANADIKDLIKMIKDAKDQIPSQFKDGVNSLGGSSKQLGMLCGYNALFVSCWRNLGFESVDYGGCKPTRVMYNLNLKVVASCVPCLPWSRTDGVNVMAFCVEEEHVAAFHGEMARLK